MQSAIMGYSLYNARMQAAVFDTTGSRYMLVDGVPAEALDVSSKAGAPPGSAWETCERAAEEAVTRSSTGRRAGGVMTYRGPSVLALWTALQLKYPMVLGAVEVRPCCQHNAGVLLHCPPACMLRNDAC